MTNPLSSAALGSHHHRVFGLNVDSCLLLTAEMQAKYAGSIDIEIVAGAVPMALPDVQKQGVRFQVGAGCVLLTVDGVGRFFVEAGRRITMACDPAADEDDLRAFLVGPAFGALLHQRGELVLRGSAITIGGKGVLILGALGAGKSTLAAALEQRDATFLSDDLCVVRPTVEGEMRIHAGFLERRLWPDSLAELGVTASGLPRVRQGVERRAVRITCAVQPQSVPVQKIYVLRSRVGREVGFTPIEGMRKFHLLNRQTYRREFLDGLDAKARQCELSMRLARQTSAAIVHRPDELSSLNMLAARCLEDLCP
jgi:hypothetical protein